MILYMETKGNFIAEAVEYSAEKKKGKIINYTASKRLIELRAVFLAAIHRRITQWILNFECTRIAAFAECNFVAAHHILRRNNGEILIGFGGHICGVLCERNIFLFINNCRHYLAVIKCNILEFG